MRADVRWFCLIVSVLAWIAPLRVWAWSSLEVNGDRVVVDVDPDGGALISHQLAVTVRGGPLKSLMVRGVDSDAEPLGEASIVRARAGQEAGYPIPLVPTVDGESLKLQLSYKRGVSGGQYWVRFSYRTRLVSDGAVRDPEGRREVRWRHIELPDGVDSVTAEFRLPRGRGEPVLARVQDAHGVQLASGADGVFLSELRREAEVDVLTLTRPHVARGERVLWSFLVSPELFGGFDGEVAVESPESEPSGAVAAATGVGVRPAARAQRYQVLVWALAAGFAYALLLWLKWRWLSALAQQTRARVTFLLPLVTWLRMSAIGLAFAAAIVLAADVREPTSAAFLWLVALLLSVMVPRAGRASPRGPGRWEICSTEEALSMASPPPLGWGRVLDAGNWLGLLVLSGSGLMTVVACLGLLDSEPYWGVAGLVATSALVPLYFPLGGLSALRSVLQVQGQVLTSFARRLARIGYPTVLHARRADCDDAVDELRLVLRPPRQTPGLLAFEVAVESGDRLFAGLAEPVMVVKVEERSVAHRALLEVCAAEPAFVGALLQWSRGQFTEERVLLVKPRIPSSELCVALCRLLLVGLQGAAAPEPTCRRRAPVAASRVTTPGAKRGRSAMARRA